MCCRYSQDHASRANRRARSQWETPIANSEEREPDLTKQCSHLFVHNQIGNPGSAGELKLDSCRNRCGGLEFASFPPPTLPLGRGRALAALGNLGVRVAVPASLSSFRAHRTTKLGRITKSTGEVPLLGRGWG